MNLKNNSNEYQKLLGEDFDKIPKAVLAAIAISLANRITSDNFEESLAVVRSEWWILYENKIVPQKPTIAALK